MQPIISIKMYNKQPQVIKTCKWCYMLMVGPLTKKLGTLMCHNESSSKHKLQVSEQKKPQAIKLVNGVCASNLNIVGPLTMKLGTLMYHHKSSWKQNYNNNKQPQAT